MLNGDEVREHVLAKARCVKPQSSDLPDARRLLGVDAVKTRSKPVARAHPG
jgi:hypothetical protein